MELPSARSAYSNGNKMRKGSFLRRITFGFIILSAFSFLYVPVHYSLQSPVLVQVQGWGYNTSRDVSDYIHPEYKTTLLNPSDACTPSPFLIIVVCSAVANHKSRTAIRYTWANKYNLNASYNVTVKVAFLVGQSNNETLDKSVTEESEMYNDIIQERFLDTYNNLTLKTVMLLKWITTNCETSTYVLKTDDDMFINIPKLLELLHSRPQSNETLVGCLICNARPILDPKNKWYTPKYMYSERYFPNYLSGTAYLMSIDVVLKLYKESLDTPILYTEDVYITGVCAKRAKLRPVNHMGFNYKPRKADVCVFKSVIAIHKINPDNMYTIWSQINDSNIICNQRKYWWLLFLEKIRDILTKC